MHAHAFCIRCDRDEPLSPHGLCAKCASTVAWVADRDSRATQTAGNPLSTTQASADTGQPSVDEESAGLTALSRFEVLGSLGRGGMGAVWKVRERASGELFALKTLQRRGGQARFEVEAQALTRLRHPNIIRVFEIDLADEAPYFTMELADGGTLEDRARRDGPLDPVEAARLVETIARAVEHAHQAGVLHRDLKPVNVLLTADGQPKVSDFGLAKRLDRSDGRTATIAMLGTPGYMAPEQVSRRYGRMGPATDVYGLGATLYRLVTGRPVVVTADKDTVEVITETTSGPVPDPRDTRSDLPDDLALICRKCLQKDSRDRYPTAAAVADDLSAWLAGQKPRARLPSRARLAVRAVTRRWQVAVGAVLLTSVVVLAITLARRKSPPDPIPPEDSLAKLQADFRAGRADVVPERGPPRWTHWVLRPSTFGDSPLNDGSAAVQTLSTSLVDLFVPDADRYRVSVELRQLRQPRPDPGVPVEPVEDGDFVGLTLCRQERSLPDGTRVHAFLTVRFVDYVGPRLAKLNPNARTQLKVVTVVHVPEKLPAEASAGVPKAASFPPAESLPGPWRRIEAFVTRDWVRVRWQPLDTAPVEEIAAIRRADIAGHVARLTAGGLAGDSFREQPFQFDPKAPLGLYCKRSYLAVRNLTVAPLSPE